jgi:hypothetical protein
MPSSGHSQRGRQGSVSSGPNVWLLLELIVCPNSAHRVSESLAGESPALSCCNPARRLNIYGVHHVVAAVSHEIRQSVYMQQ